jgi:hypothetical protein
VVWQRYKPPLVETRYVVELDKLTPAGQSPSVVYLYARVDAPQAMQGSLVLRSDAAVKLFLDGQSVFARHRHRRPGPLRIPIALRAGSNNLLLKLEHTGGEGRLIAQLETPEPVSITLP